MHLTTGGSLVCRAKAESQPYECQIGGNEGENYAWTIIQCWVPPANEEIKGVLCVVLHPYGSTGMVFAHPEPWIRLATRYHCALVAVSFVEADDQTQVWFHASLGTGSALLEGLNELANRTNRPSLRKVPLVLIGVCGAGEFAYEFSAYNPYKTAAFVSIGGSQHDPTLASAVANISGMLVASPDRGDYAVRNVFDLFKEGRKLLAPWSFSLEPIQDYNMGYCSSLIIDYLETSLKALSASKNNMEQSPHSIACVPLGSGLPLDPTEPHPEDSLYSEIHASVLACVFPTQEIADKWRQGNFTTLNENFSLVGKPVLSPGILNPHVRDLGNIVMHDRQYPEEVSTIIAKSSQGEQADQICVLANANKVGILTRRISQSEWSVRLQLKPQAFPAGYFDERIAVSFQHKSLPVLGGLMAHLEGVIVNDIYSQPKSLLINALTATGTTVAKLEILSKSNEVMDYDGMEYSSFTWAKVEAENTKGQMLQLRCIFSPPARTQGAFAGYFILRIKSDQIYRIRVSYLGTPN
jgi:hypothetical protein